MAGTGNVLKLFRWRASSRPYLKELNKFGPIKPVEREGEINYKSYQATIVIKTGDGLKEIEQFTSNNDGTFKIYLKPGKYILEPLKSSEPFPIGTPVEAEVKPSQFTEIHLSFDTGIR